jgi:hypothetical protein
MKNFFSANMNKNFSCRDANIRDIYGYFLFLKLFLDNDFNKTVATKFRRML